MSLRDDLLKLGRESYARGVCDGVEGLVEWLGVWVASNEAGATQVAAALPYIRTGAVALLGGGRKPATAGGDVSTGVATPEGPAEAGKEEA